MNTRRRYCSISFDWDSVELQKFWLDSCSCSYPVLPKKYEQRVKCTFWPKTLLQKKVKEDNCKGLKVRFHIQLCDKMNFAYFLVGQVSYSIIRWNEHCIHFLVAYIQIWSWSWWSWSKCCSLVWLKENDSSSLKLQEIRPCMRSKMAARRSIILSTIQEAME